MLKFLFITFIIGYLFFKVIGMVFKFVARGTTSSSHQQYRASTNGHQQKRPADGNVNIDYVPNKDKKSKESFKGGDYVDFEEIK